MNCPPLASARSSRFMVFLISACLSAVSLAQEKAVFRFTGGNGFQPNGTLVADAAGNLYGTTYEGGNLECSGSGCGLVFELIPEEGGAWSAKILHVFTHNGVDGSYPNAPLVFDKSGNLYGTTTVGGSATSCSYAGLELGCGTVFELSPASSGSWNETILHSFNNNGQDGYFPNSGVILNSNGKLYGETSDGGSSGDYGTVFEMSSGHSGWTETLLHTFDTGTGDGGDPLGGLVFDNSGNLYGTTVWGGEFSSYGTVFELTPSSGVGWTETILHSFNQDGRDGYEPEHGVILGSAGDLYGTTLNGGTGGGGIGLGTIFELSPGADETWTETILYDFGQSATDGYYPGAGLVQDSKGTFYGTTTFGGECGQQGNCGTVYQLQPKNGAWMENVVFTFPFDSDVHSTLIRGLDGFWYGAGTLGGGSKHCEVLGHYGCGFAFEIKP
jgi:uncharacterized repeat protein (TIGR03803 family)